MYINNLITGTMTIGSGGSSETNTGYWRVTIGGDNNSIAQGTIFILNGERTNSTGSNGNYNITLDFEEDFDDYGTWNITIYDTDLLSEETGKPETIYFSQYSGSSAITQFTDEYSTTSEWITQ